MTFHWIKYQVWPNQNMVILIFSVERATNSTWLNRIPRVQHLPKVWKLLSQSSTQRRKFWGNGRGTPKLRIVRKGVSRSFPVDELGKTVWLSYDGKVLTEPLLSKSQRELVNMIRKKIIINQRIEKKSSVLLSDYLICMN